MIAGSCHCGAIHYEFDGQPESATSCSCTVCRRYGVLWAYDYENERIRVRSRPGSLVPYIWGDKGLGFYFCKTCGCVVHWRALSLDDDGRRRIAVNLRLAEPQMVADIPVRRFDGLETWSDLPPDGRCVADVWF